MSDLQEKYLHLFSHLRRGVTPYGLAPHKLILLLTVIHELEEGRLPENRIELTNRLQKTFQTIWNEHVRSKHIPNIALPFYHLQHDGFWHLQIFSHQREWFDSRKSIHCLGTLQKTVQCAILDPELYELFMNPTFRETSKQLLIRELQQPNSETHHPCLFCENPTNRTVVAESDLALAFYDQYPVSEGHTLIIPKRHVASYFDLKHDELIQIHDLSFSCRNILHHRYHPDGFNLGINVGASAGQTIFHCHVHLIPRYHGDVSDPRGGVRSVIPHKQYYI